MKLEIHNYSSWPEDMKALLMEKNCWRIVSGTAKQPINSEGSTITKQLQDFDQRKDKAYSSIYLNMNQQYHSLISDIEIPVEAWVRIEKHFRPDSRARVIGLTDEFFNCLINPGEAIGLYAARLKKITSQLHNAGKPISEWYQAFQLIRYPELPGIQQDSSKHL